MIEQLRPALLNEQEFHFLLRIRWRGPPGQSLRHDFRCGSRRLLGGRSKSRVACETYAKSNIVVVGGEITTKAQVDFTRIAREAIREIGYVHDDDVFHADRVFVMNIVTQQSPRYFTGR